MHGRASLMESLVWLIPFLCVKRREKRAKRREKMKEKIKGSSEKKRHRDETK